MATRTYQIQLELTNGQSQIAGNFSVTDGENGQSITDLEIEPASSTDEGNTYNVYYKVGTGERQLAGDFMAPRGEQGKAGTNGKNGSPGAAGRPVYYKTSGTALNDVGLSDYIVALNNLYPTTPTPVVGDTVILSTRKNTYIGSIKQIQSSGAVVIAKTQLNSEKKPYGLPINITFGQNILSPIDIAYVNDDGVFMMENIDPSSYYYVNDSYATITADIRYPITIKDAYGIYVVYADTLHNAVAWKDTQRAVGFGVKKLQNNSLLLFDWDSDDTQSEKTIFLSGFAYENDEIWFIFEQ